MSGGVGRGVFSVWKWYNIRRFMGEKTQENSQMGYSAAYPTDAERITELILREIRKYKKKGVRR